MNDFYTLFLILIFHIFFRSSYDSIDQNNNPSMYSSVLTSAQNIESNYPGRSVVSAYPSVSYPYGPNGIGSGSNGWLKSPKLISSSYPSGSYGLGSGSYGYAGSFGGIPGSYRSSNGPNGRSVLYGSSGSNGCLGLYGSSVSNGYLGSYGLSGSTGSYGLSGSLGSYGSALPSAVIPTSYSSSIPCQNGINIAQQIIHKPVVTELQEVIHKPIISELQEIVNKPVISEIQQVIHKPLYTEHIGFGPSYQGYQKHIVKQPIYQKPTRHFVHQPMSHGGTINLADEYEHAINTAHNIYGSETSSPCGYSGTPYMQSTGIGMQSNTQYGSAVSMPNVAAYEPVYSSGVTNEVSNNFAPFIHSSAPCRYASNPSSQNTYRYAAPAPIDFSTPTSSAFSLPSNGYASEPISGKSFEQRANVLNGNEELNQNVEEKLQPKSAEQIIYDKLVPYKQQPNVNPFQQLSESQQLGRSSIEDTKNIKMNVDAIAKQIEKNPEMRKQLLKIITENIYVGDKITQTDKKQDKTIQ